MSDLTTDAGYLLRTVSNAVSQELARKFAGEGVTVAEWAMMASLSGGAAIAPSALARKIGMTKGAISKLAERLAGKGLIVRSGNPEDKRGHNLSLSAEGAKKVPVLARLADENDVAFFSVLGGEEQKELWRLLHALTEKHGLFAMPVD